MIPLLADAIRAHGDLTRWNAYRTLTATVVSGGDLGALKGVCQDRSPWTMQVDLHRQWTSMEPFGKVGQRADFTPERVAIVTKDTIVAERRKPRESFARHDMRTSWDVLHHAYFSGCALWTCMTAPFLLAMDGFRLREIEPWCEGIEIWRGLRATFPATITTHSAEQDFYFGPDMLIRRHDYNVEIAGSFAIAHYVSDPVDIDGIKIPTRQRGYLRADDLKPMFDAPMVTIDLSDLCFH